MQLQQQQHSTRRWPITRHYDDEAQYTADAASLAAAGWDAVSVKRDPSGSVIATWLEPAAAKEQPAAQVQPQPAVQAQPQAQPAASEGFLTRLRRFFGG